METCSNENEFVLASYGGFSRTILRINSCLSYSIVEQFPSADGGISKNIEMTWFRVPTVDADIFARLPISIRHVVSTGEDIVINPINFDGTQWKISKISATGDDGYVKPYYVLNLKNNHCREKCRICMDEKTILELASWVEW